MAMRRTGEGWRCSECGRIHDGLITCFGPDQPYGWHQAPLSARVTGWLGTSFCRVRIDGQRQFYVRGHLPIPVRGHDDEPVFLWNVWVQVSRSDYRMLTRTLNDPRRVYAAPIAGVLDTPLPYKSATRGLPVDVHNRPPGNVPHVWATRVPGHPLQAEQEQGMSVHRLAELNRELLAWGP
jgi:hypothetical protein